MKKVIDNTKHKVTLKEMFEEYARKELETIEKSDPNKLLHRVIPNIRDKDKGSIEFLYKKIVVGGFIDKDKIYLNKLRVSKWGKEEDVEEVLAKVKETIEAGDMTLINQL